MSGRERALREKARQEEAIKKERAARQRVARASGPEEKKTENVRGWEPGVKKLVGATINFKKRDLYT